MAITPTDMFLSTVMDHTPWSMTVDRFGTAAVLSTVIVDGPDRAVLVVRPVPGDAAHGILVTSFLRGESYEVRFDSRTDLIREAERLMRIGALL